MPPVNETRALGMAAMLLAAPAWADPPHAETFRSVHHSELTLVERVEAELPEGASCVLRVFVDVSGAPVEVTPRPDQCPAEQVEASVAAVSRWRWEPVAKDGTAGPFRTYVKLEGARPEAAPEPPPVALEHTELQLLRRVVPDYPRNLPPNPSGRVRCKVRVFIDEQGVPYGLEWEQCPMDFRPAVEAVLPLWRWRPAIVGGEPVKAQFVLTVHFAA